MLRASLAETSLHSLSPRLNHQHVPQPNCVLVGDTTHTPCFRYIRASVDALYVRRDGTGEMSRDPRTKASKTRRERLAMPSKYPKDHSRGPYLLIHMPKCILCPCSARAQRTVFHTDTSAVARACASMRTYIVRQPLPLTLQREKGGAEHALKMSGTSGKIISSK